VNGPVAEREGLDEAQAGLAPSEFADLYTAHSRAIYYLALRFLGDPQKAEDATHDVFLKAFPKMDQFRGDPPGAPGFIALPSTIAATCSNPGTPPPLHQRRRRGLGNRRAQGRLAFARARNQGARPAHPKGARQLSEEYRLLLLLVADEELSYEQVGALTDQSPDAVRGKLHRARKAFAVLFKKSS
jgi:RNA polymerase sigma-70 factor (ECF subfamily)